MVVKDCVRQRLYNKKIPTLCCGFFFLSEGYAFNIDMKIKNDDQTIGGFTKETLTQVSLNEDYFHIISNH